MDNQIYFCKDKGQWIPVKPKIFKHGGGIYITLTNHTEGVRVPLTADAVTMIAQLRQMASLIEATMTTKDQGYISRSQKASAPTHQPIIDRLPVVTDLNGDPRHDWPLFVKRFHGGAAKDVLLAIAQYYKKEFGYSAPDIEATLEAEEKLLQDFELVRPVLPYILDANGLRRGARARVAGELGIKDAGNYRGRIDSVIQFILDNFEELLGSQLGNDGKSNETNPENDQQFYQKQKVRAL